ncbi:MAG: hypothetical protein AAGB34_06165 [Planctomycetota bacterium]
MIATLIFIYIVNLMLLLGGVVLLDRGKAIFGERWAGIRENLERAPGLDLAVTYFTALPLFGGFLLGHRAGQGSLLFGLVGMVAGALAMSSAVILWTNLHERQHSEAVKGPRIVKALNAQVGPIRNHIAVWYTALAVPVFWIIRLAEYVVYPPVAVLIKLPRYKHGDWVNISRHKFEGLVGHDLIWCLYCDWMTGIWSLGSEMLRNIESFWCPIRFYDNKKCENCKIDFPDVDNSWVPADGNMQDVSDLITNKLSDGNHSWHGHPTRLTVEGEELAQVETPAVTPSPSQEPSGPEEQANT